MQLLPGWRKCLAVSAPWRVELDEPTLISFHGHGFLVYDEVVEIVDAKNLCLIRILNHPLFRFPLLFEGPLCSLSILLSLPGLRHLLDKLPMRIE